MQTENPAEMIHRLQAAGWAPARILAALGHPGYGPDYAADCLGRILEGLSPHEACYGPSYPHTPSRTAHRHTWAAWARSHAGQPSGRGRWAVQASRTFLAHGADLYGPVEFVQGTPQDAFRRAAQLWRDAPYLALLP